MKTQRFSRSARIGRWAILVMAICAIFGLLLLGGRDLLRLLERATRITDVHDWGLERPDLDLPVRIYNMMSGGAQYQWLGPGQVLFFHGLKPIQAIVTRVQGVTHHTISWPASVGSPTVYDVATHQEHPLSQLTHLFQQGEGKATKAEVSPYGQRLLWKGSTDTLHITTLDGSQHVDIPDIYNHEIRWLPDGKRFYSYGWGTNDHKKDVFSVDVWDVDTKQSISKQMFAQPTDYDMLGDCALTPAGELATNTIHLPHVKLTLYLLTPEPKSAVRAFPITLPPDTTVDTLEYSPGGDHLAWVMTRTYLPPLLTLLHRCLPFYKPSPQRVVSLWVSSATGSGLHEIGHIPISETGRQFYLIDYVRWLPDGKSLSFVSNNVLYTVPSE